MQVYKAFFKIIKKNLSQIMIYVTIFLFFAISLGNLGGNPTETDFNETKVNVAFINEDENTDFIKGFKEYIGENSNIVEIEDDREKLQDAIYYQTVSYIIRVPKGFTEMFINEDKDVDLQIITEPNSVNKVYMDSVVNKYLNTVKKYIRTVENLSQSQLTKYVSEDLKEDVKVRLTQNNDKFINTMRLKNYYNYLSYSTFAILILGISSVMLVFNNKDLKMRNYSSSLKLRSFNFQMILGNITFAIAVWGVMVLASFIMYGKYMLTMTGALFLLNSFIFTIAALSIGFLISNLVSSRNAMSAAANVVSLGCCFLSGVFVPQELLGDTVLKIASFNPTFWYVKANNSISTLVNFNKETLTPIIWSMLIMLGFAIAILSITLVIIKKKSVNS